MSSRLLFSLAAAAMFAVSSPASAQLDPQPKTPYLWQIVLKVQPHPLLSATFRQQLKRDLEAALQPALGPLGAVEVKDLAELSRDKWEPLWQQFEDKGFAALEAPRDLNAAKTHFLRIEYKDGQYLLEARQHDGFTGLSSGYAGFGTPVIRKESVRVPELVGRTAGLMLYRDFGLDGTVEQILANAKEVKVHVRGGQLGSVKRLVTPGDVFAVCEVAASDRKAPEVRTSTGKLVNPAPGSAPAQVYSSRLRSNSLLKVTEVGDDGVLKCDVLGRPFQIPQGRMVGYRCLKLGTVNAPVTVRLVGSDGSASKAADLVTVRGNEKSFEDGNNASDIFDRRDGLFRSARPLSNVACVTVTLGPTQSKKFPIPVLSSDPVNLTVEIDPAAEEKAMYERAAIALFARVRDARNAQTVCFEATAKLIEKQKNTEAKDRAVSGHKAAVAAAESIADELKQLKETSEKSPNTGKVLTLIQQNLDALTQFNKQLETHIDTLDKVVKRENDPASAAKEVQAQAKQEQIKVLLSRGEVEEAISAYDQLAILLPNDPNVRASQEALKKEWATKSPEHAAARTYLLKTWPTVASISDFKESLPQLTKAIEECKKQNDKYALRKLLVIFSSAVVKLNELVAALDTSSDNDRKLAADATVAGEALAAREQELRDFLK
jgi:tetratricopeptide (TPR) repeat protein